MVFQGVGSFDDFINPVILNSFEKRHEYNSSIQGVVD